MSQPYGARIRPNGKMLSWTKNKYLDLIVVEYSNCDLPLDFKLPFLEDNLDKLTKEGWQRLCCNESIPWQFYARLFCLSSKGGNESGGKYRDKAHWSSLCGNKNIPWQFYEYYLPWIFQKAEKDESQLYLDCWMGLCRNTGIPWQFFERHLHLLGGSEGLVIGDCWRHLYKNTNIPWQFFEKHYRLDWSMLCRNTTFIRYIKVSEVKKAVLTDGYFK